MGESLNGLTHEKQGFPPLFPRKSDLVGLLEGNGPKRLNKANYGNLIISRFQYITITFKELVVIIAILIGL